MTTIFKINKIPKGPDVVHVNVIGHRWWWEYQYTDADSQGIVTANELHIPAGRPVALDLTSVDVIHNFWPPRLNGKIYAIPGRHNKLTIEADKPDTYYGQCAEYCGLSHANMRLRVVAHDPTSWTEWLAGQQAAPPIPKVPRGLDGLLDSKALTALPVDQQDIVNGALVFQNKGCAACHAVTGYSDGLSGPNLSHLQSRKVFAGAIFDITDGNLRKWLRNPPAEKPMQPEIVNNPGGFASGMPNLHLTEQEITQLIAFLDTLK